jgi:hypothetical protein
MRTQEWSNGCVSKTNILELNVSKFIIVKTGDLKSFTVRYHINVTSSVNFDLYVYFHVCYSVNSFI